MPEPLTDEQRLAALSDALETLRDLADRIQQPQLGLSTPCDEFDVRRLLEHVIGWQRVVVACAAGDAPPFADGSPTYRLQGTGSDDLRQSSTALVAALARSSEPIDLPYRGPTDRSSILDEQVAEMVIHTWDLARALGVDATFDERTIAVAHGGLTVLLQQSFAPYGFRTVDDRSSSRDGLNGLIERSGRQPLT